MSKKKNMRKNKYYAYYKYIFSLSPKRKISVETERHAIIFKSELDFIAKSILDYPNIETGGQLFGFFTDNGTPVVQYVIGPGRNANHQVSFFNQDIEYLQNIGRFLNTEYGLHHIGEWHSHHQLGLPRPSGHDQNTMINTIRENQLGQFMLCIGTCDRFRATINPFICDDNKCQAVSWDVIDARNHLRLQIDARIKGTSLDQSERIETTRRTSPGIQTAYVPIGNRMPNPILTNDKPQYAREYWMNNKENHPKLKNMLDYVKQITGNQEVKVKLDERGHVHIERRNQMVDFKEDIYFPQDFPSVNPIITRSINGHNIAVNNPLVETLTNDIAQVFTNFYKKFLEQNGSR